MGLLQYVTHFFEPLPAAGRQAILGQLAWIVVPNLPPQPNIIETERVQQSSHAVAKARWTSMTDDHFRRRPSKSYPILNIKLGETEELLAFAAKRRPAVVVADHATHLGGIDAGAPGHHEEKRLVMAPIYGLRSDDDPKGFGPILATRVRHLLYWQFFPFKHWREERRGVDGATSFDEGIIRFDRLQFASPSPPGLKLIPLRLSDNVLPFLHAMLWAYLHAEPWAELVELREMLNAYLPDEAKPGG